MNTQITTEVKIDQIEEEAAVMIEANLEYMSDEEIISINPKYFHYMSMAALKEITRRCDVILDGNISEHNNCDGSKCNCGQQEPSASASYIMEQGSTLVLVCMVVAVVVVLFTVLAPFAGLPILKIGEVLAGF